MCPSLNIAMKYNLGVRRDDGLVTVTKGRLCLSRRDGPLQITRPVIKTAAEDQKYLDSLDGLAHDTSEPWFECSRT